MPGQGPRGWQFRAGRRGGLQNSEHSECPVGEREWSTGGGRGSLTLLPEACHIGRDHSAVVVPLAVGGLSLPLLP